MRSTSAVLIIVITGLTLTYFGFLPLNNTVSMFFKLQKPTITSEYRSITESQYIMLKEETPKIAAKVISDKVGLDYFQRNFYLYHQGVLNYTDGDWFAQVLYAYVLKVGNYTNLEDSSVFFDEKGRVIRTEGIPEADNLMPFSVTEDQAILIARYVSKSREYTSVAAQIRNVSTYDLFPRVDKYAWVVAFEWATNVSANSKDVKATLVVLDASTGWVYSVRTYQGTVTQS